jgi:hypothetical protein
MERSAHVHIAHLVLMIVAAILFGLAALGVRHPTFDLVAAGLCCLTISFITV